MANGKRVEFSERVAYLRSILKNKILIKTFISMYGNQTYLVNKAFDNVSYDHKELLRNLAKVYVPPLQF